ncbi:MAG: phenylacetate--CoA ligase family protein [Armatimonadetes bacterium]|nr:phenylacetate--CoA ligase family protein [Armatimonadota bacterium]MDE2205233.1 phenylacetate--CoA ligase family protein [Armatimonadota bacterium]
MRDSHRYAAWQALRRFIETPLDQLLSGDCESGRRAALDLFDQARHEVPAYAAFLRDHGVDGEAIVRSGAFHEIPFTTRANYVNRWPLPARCWHGELAANGMVALSSGSTGTPAIWPRTVADELQTAIRFEQVFRDMFHADQRPTLAIVCFALGSWVGGMYTAACMQHLSSKGYPITCITPGSNRSEILRAFAELSPMFEQTVLLGYPPFLKDVIDEGSSTGLRWDATEMHLVTAGEVFSEGWRELMAERVGCADAGRFAASLYGSADAGVLAIETPLSAAIRGWLALHPSAARDMFGGSRMPTFMQYDPQCRTFESNGGALAFTADGGAPQIRYDMLDEGGVAGFAAMTERLTAAGFRMEDVGGTIRSMPFVWVFGRRDFTVSYYGANIYPEQALAALERREIAEWATGRFVMLVEADGEHNSTLRFHIELARGATDTPERRQTATAALAEVLVSSNSEFANYVPAAKQIPSITLWPTGAPEFFATKGKHRYTR